MGSVSFEALVTKALVNSRSTVMTSGVSVTSAGVQTPVDGTALQNFILTRFIVITLRTVTWNEEKEEPIKHSESTMEVKRVEECICCQVSNAFSTIGYRYKMILRGQNFKN